MRPKHDWLEWPPVLQPEPATDPALDRMQRWPADVRLRGRSTAPGFSLLEAVAAMALLALALPPVTAVISGAVARTVRMNDRTTALLRAESLLAQEKAAFRGHFGVRDGANADWQWTIEASPLPGPPQDDRSGSAQKPVPIPAHLSVSVRLNSGSSVTLDTLIVFSGARR